MGKKRVIQKTEKELLKERELVEAKSKKGSLAYSSGTKKIREGIVNISSSYNNTLISLSDIKGNIIAWSSAGSIGFKGTKKGTPFAASKAAEVISQIAEKKGLRKISIKIKGIGSGRDSAIRTLASKGLDIDSIEDITPVPHNGCRPPKPRRV